jgi:hypothetical protein
VKYIPQSLSVPLNDVPANTVIISPTDFHCDWDNTTCCYTEADAAKTAFGIPLEVIHSTIIVHQNPTQLIIDSESIISRTAFTKDECIIRSNSALSTFLTGNDSLTILNTNNVCCCLLYYHSYGSNSSLRSCQRFLVGIENGDSTLKLNFKLEEACTNGTFRMISKARDTELYNDFGYPMLDHFDLFKHLNYPIGISGPGVVIVSPHPQACQNVNSRPDCFCFWNYGIDGKVCPVGKPVFCHPLYADDINSRGEYENIYGELIMNDGSAALVSPEWRTFMKTDGGNAKFNSVLSSYESYLVVMQIDPSNENPDSIQADIALTCYP